MVKKFFYEKKGQALVEFAFVIPLLLLFLFSIVEFGRIFGAELIVAYSAREGARVGTIGSTDDDIKSQVFNSAVNLDPSKLIVIIEPVSERIRGQQISVRVRYPVAVMVPIISVITGETVTVDSTCTMRVE